MQQKSIFSKINVRNQISGYLAHFTAEFFQVIWIDFFFFEFVPSPQNHFASCSRFLNFLSSLPIKKKSHHWNFYSFGWNQFAKKFSSAFEGLSLFFHIFVLHCQVKSLALSSQFSIEKTKYLPKKVAINKYPTPNFFLPSQFSSSFLVSLRRFRL